MKPNRITLCLALFPGALLQGAERIGPDWVKETPAAAWQARDSQGEVVYNNRLWIFGGWYNSFEAPPRDVWSSPDGRNWSLVAKDAPWLHSDLPMSIAFKNRMWMMGGWYNGRLPGHSASNAVWSSKDGVKWTQVTPHAGWSPRIAAALVEFKGRMWILGGTENYYFGDARSLKSDVWSSADGRTWTQGGDLWRMPNSVTPSVLLLAGRSEGDAASTKTSDSVFVCSPVDFSCLSGEPE